LYSTRICYTCECLAGRLDAALAAAYDTNSTTVLLYAAAQSEGRLRPLDFVLPPSQNRRGCAREIAARFGLSRPFVANILKDLSQQHYVDSHRGVKGGYLLKSDAAERTLADLIDALDDTVQLAECNTTPPDSCCDLLEVCPIRGPIGEVHQRIRAVLEGVTLADLFQQSAMDQPVQLNLSKCEK
jgi:Rrf2 family protein